MTDFRFTHAWVRPVGRSLAECQLAHLQRQPIELALATQQHLAYTQALRAAGVDVTSLPEAPELPDGVFVEDTAIMLDELAVLCRPALPSRQPEVDTVAAALAGLRPVRRIVSPGTLEGGDILRIGRTLFVGRSRRTNNEGLRQLENFVAAHDYRVVGVDVSGALHLKTAVTSPAQGLLLVNPHWIDLEPFRQTGLELCPVPVTEPWGANTLSVNGAVFVARSVPRTAELLRACGLDVQLLEISELQKAEGGLTCLSLLYR